MRSGSEVRFCCREEVLHTEACSLKAENFEAIYLLGDTVPLTKRKVKKYKRVFSQQMMLMPGINLLVD
jgi:hypothetical protein